MADKEIAGELPADEGHLAFTNRKTLDDNPYEESDWRHKEWNFGWECEEQSNPELFDWNSCTFRSLKHQTSD